jgi:hypothetical protein
MATKRDQRAEGSFRVGDRVEFWMGPEHLEGVIVEDRGAIGAGGRRLFRVEVHVKDYDATFEIPADEIRRAG